jgi:hypothetical protein
MSILGLARLLSARAWLILAILIIRAGWCGLCVTVWKGLALMTERPRWPAAAVGCGAGAVLLASLATSKSGHPCHPLPGPGHRGRAAWRCW